MRSSFLSCGLNRGTKQWWYGVCLLLGCAGILWSGPTVAGSDGVDEDGLYRVEVLVFQYRDDTQLADEHWHENPGYPRFEKAIKLLPLAVDEVFTDEDIEFENDPEAVDGINALFMKDDAMAFSMPEMSEPSSVEFQVPHTDLSQLGEMIAAVEEENTPLESVIEDEVIVGVSSYFVPYQVLADEALYLTPFKERLAASDDYLPLLLTGWVQSVENPNVARAVYLNSRPEEASPEETLSEEVFSEAMQTIPPRMFVQEQTNENNVFQINQQNRKTLFIPTESIDSDSDCAEGREELTPEPIANTMSSEVVQTGEVDGDAAVEKKEDEAVAQAEGIVLASKSTYFHVAIDIAFNKPVHDTTGEMPFYLDENWQAVFRLFESRRVNIGQINYFDHPAFGVLVYMEKVASATAKPLQF